MKDLTYFLNSDGEYEGEVVEFEKACPMFKKFNSGTFFNQLTAYIEDGTAFDLYDDIIDDLNENLESEDQYDSSYDYIRRVVLDNFDRICPMNGVKLGTLIGKIIDKKAQNNSEDEIGDDNVIEIDPLTDREIKGLTNTCYSLGVAELGIRIQYLIGIVIGEDLIPSYPIITTDNEDGTLFDNNDDDIISSVDLYHKTDDDGKYTTIFSIEYPEETVSRGKTGYNIEKDPDDDESYIINKINNDGDNSVDRFAITVADGTELDSAGSNTVNITIVFNDPILDDYEFDIGYGFTNVPELDND